MRIINNEMKENNNENYIDKNYSKNEETGFKKIILKKWVKIMNEIFFIIIIKIVVNNCN